MPSLNEKIDEVADEKDLISITIASDEGLTVASNLEEEKAEKRAASGVYKLNQEAKGSDLSFMNIYNGETTQYVYSDGEFHYVVEAENPIEQDDAEAIRKVLDEEAKERAQRQKEREKKRKEIERKRRERKKKIQEQKEKRQQRREEIEKQKQKRESRRRKMRRSKRRNV